MPRDKAPDEIFCRSCGDAIKQEAEICPNCGVENPKADSEDTSLGQHGFVEEHGTKIAWAVGTLLILSGLGMLGSIADYPLRALLGSVFFIAAGAFALPPVREHLQPQLEAYSVPTSQAAIVGIVLVGVVAGAAVAPPTDTNTDAGASDTDDVASQQEADQQAGDGEGVADTTSTPEATPTVEATPTPTQASDSQSGSSGDSGPSYAVRVKYDSDWQGALSVAHGGESSSRSISGSGTKTIEIDKENVNSISVNAQKEDDSSKTLTVQILKNGDVVSEESTDAEYGVAQTSKGFY